MSKGMCFSVTLTRVHRVVVTFDCQLGWIKKCLVRHTFGSALGVSWKD